MDLIPAGVLVPGTPRQLRGVFGALIGLQPVRWTPHGLVCAPRAAPEAGAQAALADCPVAFSVLTEVPGWPDPPAALVSGWYVRSTAHAPAPPGVRELVQAPGPGFGPWGHPTTAMCLAALQELPAGPAVDLGCGSGLLTQAWVRLRRGAVVAIDLDEDALTHTAASLAAAGLAGAVRLEHGPVTRDVARLDGMVVFANLPPAAHHQLHACMHACRVRPRALVISGFRAGTGLAQAYARCGLRVVHAARRGRWECWGLVG